MKKFLNRIDDVVHESLEGLVTCHGDLLELDAQYRFVARKERRPDKVALISGGGSGHEPLHVGFVGPGMLDAACPGQVFTSPTPDQMVAAVERVGSAHGVIFIVKNYEGDVMNFSMAGEMCGLPVATIRIDDDVAVQNSTYTTGRRGIAGTLVVEKIVGAAAERGAALAELVSLGETVNLATRSMGVALTSCTVPAVGHPTFALGDAEIEMGVGIHGEPGRRRVAHTNADKMVEELVEALVSDLASLNSRPLLLFVNGFGATPLMELYLVYHAASRNLRKRGLKVVRSLVGSYVTSLDMAGCSLTLTALDDRLTELWDAPVRTAGLRWGT
jgi:dihydroxyacetone kinase-like protein